MAAITTENISKFQENLLRWFDIMRRDFPWRDGNLTDYELIIAEVLLQRTKAETVANFILSLSMSFLIGNLLPLQMKK